MLCWGVVVRWRCIAELCGEGVGHGLVWAVNVVRFVSKMVNVLVYMLCGVWGLAIFFLEKVIFQCYGGVSIMARRIL